VRFLGAPTGRTGLLFARCNRPKVVLIDLVLQDMAGPDILRHLRQDSDLAETTFFALAADPAVVDTDAVRSAGFDHCVGKPVNMSDFLTLLRHALDLPAASPIIRPTISARH